MSVEHEPRGVEGAIILLEPIAILCPGLIVKSLLRQGGLLTSNYVLEHFRTGVPHKSLPTTHAYQSNPDISKANG